MNTNVVGNPSGQMTVAHIGDDGLMAFECASCGARHETESHCMSQEIRQAFITVPMPKLWATFSQSAYETFHRHFCPNCAEKIDSFISELIDQGRRT